MIFDPGTSPIEVMEEDSLCGPWFDSPSWDPWKTWMKANYGLPLTPEELPVFQQFTNRKVPPDWLVRNRLGIVGRRGGKSRIGAFLAIHQTCFIDHSRYLAPGEIGTAMLLASDRAQARNLFQYVEGFFSAIPLLGNMVEHQYKESFLLKNNTRIEIATADQGSVRGYTLLCAVCDEAAFWGDDAGSVIKALRPGLLTLPYSWLLILSSPYAQRGPVFELYDRHFGKEKSKSLVWQARTVDMNEDVDRDAMAEDFALDPVGSESEYNAIFRTDVEKFVSRDLIMAAIESGVTEREPIHGEMELFVDAGGGWVDSDPMSWSVAAQVGGKPVLLYLFEQRPPYNPAQVVAAVCDTAKRYGISRVTGDRFATGFIHKTFLDQGIEYTTTTKSKSDLFTELLTMLNSGGCELLDNETLVDQLMSLERKTGVGGKDRIEAPRHSHDDVANVAAGALSLIGKAPKLHLLGAWGNMMQTERSLQYGVIEDERIQVEKAERRERQRQGGWIFDESLQKKLF